MGGVLDLEGLSFDYTFQFLVFHSQTSKKYEKMGSGLAISYLCFISLESTYSGIS
jgi:hypothetical protein